MHVDGLLRDVHLASDVVERGLVVAHPAHQLLEDLCDLLLGAHLLRDSCWLGAGPVAGTETPYAS